MQEIKNLAVVGGRDFSNWKLFEETLTNYINNYGPFNLVSGGAIGADTLAKRFAIENKLVIKEYYPNWKDFGKKAAFFRNKAIVDSANAMIAFWDGKSKGTKMSIELANLKGIPVLMVSY